jgi:hypothetical protein
MDAPDDCQRLPLNRLQIQAEILMTLTWSVFILR